MLRIYCEATGRLCLYSKDEASNFNVYIGNTNGFKSFKYKAKLSGKTKANGDNETLNMQQLLCLWSIWVIFGDHSKCHWLIAKWK